MVEALERQTKVKYTKSKEELDKALRSVWFKDLEKIGSAYQIEMQKRKVIIT